MQRTPSPVPLLTAAEMQAWDRTAIERAGVPERVLMENAGRAAARQLARLHPTGRVAAVVGRGNNGGDALVMLRTLLSWGREVVAVPVGWEDPPRALLSGWDLPLRTDLEAACREAEVLVDGLLGTGATGAPRGRVADAVRAVNAAGRPVIALDGPTGIDLTDGSAAGDAVRADVTITFGAPKRGLLLYPGREHAGRILVVEVGFPPLSPGEFEVGIVTDELAWGLLPRIAPNAHKGSAGQVAVVAGRAGMGGAAIMVAMGALRSGAGLVRILSDESNRLPIQTAVPEAIFHDRAGGADAALEPADVIVAGPGMGTGSEERGLLVEILEHGLPTLLDADALTLLAADLDLLPPDAAARVLLTPHPGEMSRLTGSSVGEITADPFRAARRLAERLGCAVLLKGAPSVVAAPGEPVLANATGHSGFATGGMGDTLAGIAGAFLAAGASPREAGALALHYSGRAAEHAGYGRSLLPRDVAESLRAALSDAPAARRPTAEPDVVLDLRPPR